MLTRGMVRRPSGELEEGLSPAEVAGAVTVGGGVGWVDLEDPEPLAVQELEGLFGLHPLALEDALNPETRPKLEEYERFLFVVTRGVRTVPDPDGPAFCPIFLFLDRRVLVTVHPHPMPSVAGAVERLRKHPELLAHGPDRLLHHLLDQIVDRYFPLLDELEDRLEALEDDVFSHPRPDLFPRIFGERKVVFQLRRALTPLREVTANLMSGAPFVDPELHPFFRDVHDHVLRLLEQTEASRDMLSGLLEGHLSQVSNRTNEIMKRLTILAAVGLPFTVISGFFGMNFEALPLIRWPWGVALASGLMVISSVVLLTFIAWRRWL